MSKVPTNLKYLKSHEWIQENADGTVTIGITDHAQELLGDLVYIELPAVGLEVKSGQECAVVESVKAASDVYAPLSGKVVAVNEELSSTPEVVNKDPYGQGWLYRLQPTNAGEKSSLLDATAYNKLLESEK